MISDDGTAYIVDWSHATQGNASADAARTYLLLSWVDVVDFESYADKDNKKYI